MSWTEDNGTTWSTTRARNDNTTASLNFLSLVEDLSISLLKNQ
ncbi:hypothetical protein [Wenyingzhuangia sp. 2_MG-2023]|nr:hypothetical protein [Wenyingzhuangia sp. 2_MG-2023]MDO6738846.1 hypothetical protein [Wenyingzhuangia sp. 2_MG-2023]